MGSKEFFINLQEDFSERYAIAKFMEYSDDNFDVLTSNVLNTLKELKTSGEYTVQGWDKRPDMIAYEIYGDVQYWWIITLYNSIQTIDDIKHGMVIKYPSIQDLEDMYFSLKIKQGD